LIHDVPQRPSYSLELGNAIPTEGCNQLYAVTPRTCNPGKFAFTRNPNSDYD